LLKLTRHKQWLHPFQRMRCGCGHKSNPSYVDRPVTIREMRSRRGSRTSICQECVSSAARSPGQHVEKERKDAEVEPPFTFALAFFVLRDDFTCEPRSCNIFYFIYLRKAALISVSVTVAYCKQTHLSKKAHSTKLKPSLLILENLAGRQRGTILLAPRWQAWALGQ